MCVGGGKRGWTGRWVLFTARQFDCEAEGALVGLEEANCGRPGMSNRELTVLKDQLTVKVKGHGRLKMTLRTKTVVIVGLFTERAKSWSYNFTMSKPMLLC